LTNIYSPKGQKKKLKAIAQNAGSIWKSQDKSRLRMNPHGQNQAEDRSGNEEPNTSDLIQSRRKGSSPLSNVFKQMSLSLQQMQGEIQSTRDFMKQIKRR